MHTLVNVNYGEQVFGYKGKTMIEIDYDDLKEIDLKEELLDNGLIIIRDADISLEEFEKLAHSLGKPLVTDRHVLNESRTVQELSETGLFGSGDVYWHNDWSYGRGNYFGTVLRNVKNAELSPTWFVDMSEVPVEFFDLYADAVGHYYPPISLHDVCFTEKQLELLKKQNVSRPFDFEHPVTGERVLYCSPGTIQDNEYDLIPVIEWAEANAYVHQWEPNDMLIWDNITMMHKRVAFQGERLLWRTQFTI